MNILFVSVEVNRHLGLHDFIQTANTHVMRVNARVGEDVMCVFKYTTSYTLNIARENQKLNMFSEKKFASIILL